MCAENINHCGAQQASRPLRATRDYTPNAASVQHAAPHQRSAPNHRFGTKDAASSVKNNCSPVHCLCCRKRRACGSQRALPPLRKQRREWDETAASTLPAGRTGPARRPECALPMRKALATFMIRVSRHATAVFRHSQQANCVPCTAHVPLQQNARPCPYPTCRRSITCGRAPDAGSGHCCSYERGSSRAFPMVKSVLRLW